ncbi:gp510 [Bacillus phage G]|uniref:Gp510 n=1 Tax=Bacillus phage G TaxID=2884420 RepID=G3MAQ1_9CAUD|nr:gp510 [Bacillus phage G]AEO93768.1 gp510 [Bacillus phage G]
MFEYMRETLEKVFTYKGEVDDNLEELLITVACNDIANKYYILRPNEDGIRDATIINNIENSQVSFNIPSTELNVELVFNAGLYGIIKNGKSVENVINTIQSNAIVILNNEAVDEFYDYMEIKENLSGDRYSDTYLTQISTRNLLNSRATDSYLENLTDEDDFKIKEVSCFFNIIVGFEHSTDIDFPDITIHDNDPIDEQDFIKDAKGKLMKAVRFKFGDEVAKDMNINCVFLLNEDDAMKYFKQVEDFKMSYNGYRLKIVRTFELPVSKACWNIRLRLAARDFLNYLIEEVL